MPDKSAQTIALAWKVLYDEDYDSIPDPNKPENIPYMKAQQKERIEAFKMLLSGPTKVLFEDWSNKIRRTNLALLFTPNDKLCNCPVCSLVRDIRSTLELMLEVEAILAEDKE